MDVGVYVRKTRFEMERESFIRAMDEYIEITKVDEYLYLAENHEYGTSYIITVVNDEIIGCDCPHHIYRDVICKHIYAANILLQIPISQDLFA